MKKLWLVLSLVLVLVVPRQSRAQDVNSDAYKLGTAIGKEIKKTHDENVAKRKAEKVEQERKQQEYWKNYPKMKREEEQAEKERIKSEKNRNAERITKLNEEDDINKQRVTDGFVSYKVHNSQERQLLFLDGPCNKVTFFSEVGEPLVFSIGFDDDWFFCLDVYEEMGPIMNEQRITFDTKMEFYGSWKDNYRFMYDVGSITIPANTTVYKKRLSQIFPKYSSRLRSYEMVNANDLKSWNLDKMTISISNIRIATKVSKDFFKASFRNYNFAEKRGQYDDLSDYQNSPIITMPFPEHNHSGIWSYFETNDGNTIKIWFNKGGLCYYSDCNEERLLVCDKVSRWVLHYGEGNRQYDRQYEGSFSIVLYPQKTTMIDFNEIYPNIDINTNNIESMGLKFEEDVYVYSH